MRVIVSVFDKTGLVGFAQGLNELNVELFSTGGTRRALQEAEVPVKSVEELTHFPEMLDGRVKTLHPAVHGGILARRDIPDHLAQLAQNQIETIDLVVVNLYPFVQTVTKPDVTLDEALENIDIGGPTMIRSAAKNFPYVLVVVDPADYEPVLDQLRSSDISLNQRKKLAQKAFQHVATYDTAIAQYLRQGETDFAAALTIALNKRSDLRYGENPHQQAAFYTEKTLAQPEPSITSATQLGGKELSFNNIVDADAAWNTVTDFAAPTVAIIKHTNPCGLACHQNLAEAYRRALTGDPVSAFGGIVALNRPMNLDTAKEIEKNFCEIVIAPQYDADALALLKRKRDLRILEVSSVGSSLPSQRAPALDFRHVKGGFLVQTPDSLPEDITSMRMVTDRKPAPEETPDLIFAWKAAKHVKSNAIVVAKDFTLLGMGAGQPNRVISVELALKKAGEQARGGVLASDAFFPFADAVELAANGGVSTIIQPGGSIRDDEVIAAANKHNLAMVFTGVRHFRH